MTTEMLPDEHPGPLDAFGVQYQPGRFMQSLTLHRSSAHCIGPNGCWHCWDAEAMAEILIAAPGYTLQYEDLHTALLVRLRQKKHLPHLEAHLLAGPAVWRVMGYHPFDAFRWVGYWDDGCVVPLTEDLQAEVHSDLVDRHLHEAFPGVPVVALPQARP